MVDTKNGLLTKIFSIILGVSVATFIAISVAVPLVGLISSSHASSSEDRPPYDISEQPYDYTSEEDFYDGSSEATVVPSSKPSTSSSSQKPSSSTSVSSSQQSFFSSSSQKPSSSQQYSSSQYSSSKVTLEKTVSVEYVDVVAENNGVYLQIVGVAQNYTSTEFLWALALQHAGNGWGGDASNEFILGTTSEFTNSDYKLPATLYDNGTFLFKYCLSDIPNICSGLYIIHTSVKGLTNNLNVGNLNNGYAIENISYRYYIRNDVNNQNMIAVEALKPVALREATVFKDAITGKLYARIGGEVSSASITQATLDSFDSFLQFQEVGGSWDEMRRNKANGDFIWRLEGTKAYLYADIDFFPHTLHRNEWIDHDSVNYNTHLNIVENKQANCVMETVIDEHYILENSSGVKLDINVFSNPYSVSASDFWGDLGFRVVKYVEPEPIAQPTGTFFTSAEITDVGQTVFNTTNSFIPIFITLGSNNAVSLNINGQAVSASFKSFDQSNGVLIITTNTYGDISMKYNPETEDLENLSFVATTSALKNDGAQSLKGNGKLKYWNCDGTTSELQAEWNRRYGNPWTLDTTNADRVAQNTEHYISGSAMRLRPYSSGRVALAKKDFAEPFNARNISFWVYNSGSTDAIIQCFCYKQTNYGTSGMVTAFSSKSIPAGQWTYISASFTASDLYAFQIFVADGASALIFDDICLF